MKTGNSRNRGSSVIEMTLLMPVLLGCIFMYILFFLYFLEQGKTMEQLSECAYSKEEIAEGVSVYYQGNTKVVSRVEEQKWFIISLELRKDESDPVTNLRRWQIIADTVQ